MPPSDSTQLTRKVPTLRPGNATVTIRRDGSLFFDTAAVSAFNLHQDAKVALIYHEPTKRLVICPVPDWMGGVRLTAQRNGALTAEQGLDFLFDQFARSRQTKIYAARWDIAHGFVIVPMSLSRKRKGTPNGTPERRSL